MVRTRIGAIASLGLLIACTGTRTGNPNDPGPEGPDLPDGVDLVRSTLAREAAPDVSLDDRMQLGLNNQRFAFDLYGEAARNDGNLFFSPYSISLAMAMTYAGAEAETEREMAEVLHFALPEPELHAAFNATDVALAQRAKPIEFEGMEHDGMELSIVNAAFTQRDLPFEEAFLDVLALHYGAGMYTLDFTGGPEESRETINDWAADRTEQRILDLLPERSLSERVALVLANAIYFKANWAIPFDVDETTDGVFHAPAGDVTAAMMNGTIQGQYAAGDGYQALELPYVPTSVRAVFILPEQGRLEEIEAALGTIFLDVRGQLSTHIVTMAVPRFRYGAKLELKTLLSELGMPDAFTEGVADFSDITRERSLHIDEVYHQAFVALDEHGTEAAASSAVVLPGRGVSPPAEFVLNRPFVFVIYDEPTDQILFLGRLSDPT